MKVLIIGGVAGGATAAARIRRLDEKAEIVIIERSHYISYANCGLPYFVGGVIKDKRDLTLQTPESFSKRYKVEVRVRHEAMRIVPSEKKVVIRDLSSNDVYEERYDKLILSTGAKAVKPSIEGIDSPRVLTLKTVEDALLVKELSIGKNSRKALVIGGGFIGIEMVENFRHLGLEVTLVERGSQILPQLDGDMATMALRELESNGVKALFGVSVLEFLDEGETLKAKLSDGSIIESDFAILSIGVMPETELAKDAGIKLGIKGAVSVNEKMETSVKDIYAIGDMVEIRHIVNGKKALISLAGPANKEARILANNLCGISSAYKGALGTSIVKVFSLNVASTGFNERQLIEEGADYEAIVLSPLNHASYYPGSYPLTMKVLFRKKDGLILGAQIIGKDGVDKRIDVLATAIKAKMTGMDLTELDLAYAPPYSSAKDPVNMAGYMIENVPNGAIRQFHFRDIESLRVKNDVFLLDARTRLEFEKGHIEGFTNIPLDELRGRLGELPADKGIYLMCETGLRSYLACRLLTQHGFECYNLAGGYRFYSACHGKGKKENDGLLPCGLPKGR